MARTYIISELNGDRGEYSLGRLASRSWPTAQQADRAARAEARRRDIPGAYWGVREVDHEVDHEEES